MLLVLSALMAHFRLGWSLLQLAGLRGFGWRPAPMPDGGRQTAGGLDRFKFGDQRRPIFWGAGGPPNLRGLVLGCIKPGFCIQTHIFQHFSTSTRFTCVLCFAPLQLQNVGQISRLFWCVFDLFLQNLDFLKSIRFVFLFSTEFWWNRIGILQIFCRKHCNLWRFAEIYPFSKNVTENQADKCMLTTCKKIDFSLVSEFEPI